VLDVDGLFITGTDTGVGKTAVTVAIARTMRDQGHRPLAIKPIATGCRIERGRWANDDTLALAEATGADIADVTHWGFPEPVAPCVVAGLYDVKWSVARFVRHVQRQSESGRPLLVEGVGGLLCPLTLTATVADWVRAMRMPTLVVARRSLGTLNHTLLTLEVARHRGIDVRGVVVSETAPPAGLAEETNVEELRKRIGVPLLGVLPFGGERLDHIDWLSLMRSRE